MNALDRLALSIGLAVALIVGLIAIFMLVGWLVYGPHEHFRYRSSVVVFLAVGGLAATIYTGDLFR